MTDHIPELDSPEFSEGREEFLASPSAIRTCPACQYPHTSPQCDNPGCSENPGVSAAVIARWALETATRAEQEAERARMFRLWSSGFQRRGL